MDDRSGCAVLLETMKQVKNSDNEIYAVFSTQEEVGLRGARTAAYAIQPDMGIALDVTLSNDYPMNKKGVTPSKLGGGRGHQGDGFLRHRPSGGEERHGGGRQEGRRPLPV